MIRLIAYTQENLACSSHCLSVKSRQCPEKTSRRNAQNPSDAFPRDFPIDGEVAILLRTCYGEIGLMDFGLVSHACRPM